MSVSQLNYYHSAGHFAAGDINWGSNTIKAALCSSSYTYNLATHEFASSLTNELSGGSYARKTLASKTSTLASSTLTLSAASLSWTAITAVNVRYVVFFKDTGSDATSILLCITDLGQNYNPTAQNFDFTIGAAGIIQFQM